MRHIEDGAAVTVAAKMVDTENSVIGVHTDMRVNKGSDWAVTADTQHPDSDHTCTAYRTKDHQCRAQATLRRVGWLDQKGRVWTETPSSLDFDGGSLTPLLIDPGERV